MTGNQFRALLAEKKISPTQFTTRYADAMVDQLKATGREPTGDDERRRRESATRTAKRWLSAKSSNRHLKMMTGNRSIVAKVVGVQSSLLDPPQMTYDAAPPDDLLEGLGEKVAFLLTENARLSKDLKDARTRLGRLERARRQAQGAATQSGGA